MWNFSDAQQTLTIRGVVFKKNSAERIAQVLVTNLKSNSLMMSDELAGFSIKAAIGDTLLVTKNGYTPQKIVVSNPDGIVVYMQPVIKLNEVTIKGQTKKQELNDVVNTYRSKGLYFDGKPSLWDIISPFGGSPLTGLYELFGKDAANERRFIKFSKNELEAVEVSKRYTKALVKSVTKLPDEEVVKFMTVFTPSYEDIKGWNDYQLILYIKKSLAYYQKNKDQPSANPAKLY